MTDSWIEIRPLPDTSGETGLSPRVAERAAWRAIVCERLGLADDTSIGYNANGAPVLTAEGTGNVKSTGSAGDMESEENAGNAGSGYISVSHTRGWVAVIWSPEPCAIDIEQRDRTLPSSVSKRYPAIRSMEDWCAFEAEYKFAGLTGHPPAPGSVRLLPHPELVVAVIG